MGNLTILTTDLPHWIVSSKVPLPSKKIVSTSIPPVNLLPLPTHKDIALARNQHCFHHSQGSQCQSHLPSLITKQRQLNGIRTMKARPQVFYKGVATKAMKSASNSSSRPSIRTIAKIPFLPTTVLSEQHWMPTTSITISSCALTTSGSPS